LKRLADKRGGFLFVFNDQDVHKNKLGRNH
jgi:hypothetical protein